MRYAAVKYVFSVWKLRRFLYSLFTYLLYGYTLVLMNVLAYERKDGIDAGKHANDLRKELLRKGIHVCALLVPPALHYFYWPTLAVLSLVLALYIFAEFARLNGTQVPFISLITAAAARKRDQNTFVLGPVTLACGVILSAVFFNGTASAIGICALALGDGVASLAGKMWGRRRIPFTDGKSAEGSLACFFAVFVSSALITSQLPAAFFLALIAMCIEMLPLKDFDNLCIPLVLSACAQYLFHFV